jgi:hypothetical protein
MWPLLFSVPVCLGLGILSLRRSRKHELPGLGLALVSCIVAIGVWGAITGEIQVVDAVHHSAAEHQEKMFKAGRTISITPLHVALVLASIVALGFGAIWMKVRHLDFPSPKGGTAARLLGYSSALLAFSGVGLYFYVRSWMLGRGVPGISEMHAWDASEPSGGLAWIALNRLHLLAIVAWLLGVLGTIGSLLSGLRGHRTPTETIEG